MKNKIKLLKILTKEDTKTNFDEIKNLIKKNSKTKYKITPNYIKIGLNNKIDKNIIKELILDLNTKDRDKELDVFTAIENDYGFKIVKSLIESGSTLKPEYYQGHYEIEGKDIFKIAIEKNKNIKFLKMLINNNGCIDGHEAEEIFKHESGLELIKYATKNFKLAEIGNDEVYDVLTYGIYSNNQELVKMLFKEGIDAEEIRMILSDADIDNSIIEIIENEIMNPNLEAIEKRKNKTNSKEIIEENEYEMNYC